MTSLSVLRVAARWCRATLRPTVVPTDQIEITGAEVPTFFHASKVVVSDIEKHSFHGWYGWGFYAAFGAEYVRRWYGPIVTRLQAKPDAKVLVASVTAALAPQALIDMVLENDFNTLLEKDESKFQEHRGYVLENPVQWVHAVDRLVIEKFDIAIYSDEQIVVKPPTAPLIILGEELPP